MCIDLVFKEVLQLDIVVLDVIPCSVVWEILVLFVFLRFEVVCGVVNIGGGLEQIGSPDMIIIKDVNKRREGIPQILETCYFVRYKTLLIIINETCTWE